jgi:hypothetical protein
MKLKKRLIRKRRFLRQIGAIVFLLLVTGCSNFSEPVQSATLEAGHNIGQTLVANKSGLNGIEVLFSPMENAQGSVILHLRESPLTTTDILTSTVTLTPQSEEKFYRFSFSPIIDSHNRYYYASFEYQGSGQIEIPLARFNTYRDGAFYDNHASQRAQMAFSLSYSLPAAGLATLLATLTAIGYGIATLIILFFSGYWIVRRWTQDERQDFTVTLTLSATVSLAAWMVVLVWIDLFSIQLQTRSVRLLVLASGLIGLFCFIRDRERWRKRGFWLGSNPWITLAFWGIVLFSIGFRLFIGRGMVMLPGSDAYHHTLIAQLFEDQGGIPSSYEPYAPLTSFSYHFGFHSTVALLRWIFGTELLATTKTTAIVVNGAIAATAGVLSEYAAKDRRAGIVASISVGLLIVSPICLLSWSRFTQSTGLLFLPAALMAFLTTKRSGWSFFPLLIAATAFSHIRISLFLSILAGLICAIALGQRRWDELKIYLVTGLLGVFLAVPWVVRLIWIQRDPLGLRTVYPLLEGVNQLQRLGRPVLRYPTNIPGFLGLVLLTIAALRSKERRTFAMALTAGCLILIIVPLISGVPMDLWDLKTVVLSVPVLLSVSAGIGGVLLWQKLRQQRYICARVVIIIAISAAVMIGLLRFPDLVAGGAIYLRPGDLTTMEWIRTNIPADAYFMNSFTGFDWMPGWAVGADSGYWVPLLAQRTSVLPPMIYPLEWSRDHPLAPNLQIFHDLQHCGTETAGEIMRRYGITHIFATYNYPPLMQMIDDDPSATEIYRQDRVRIFQLEH